LSAAGGLDVFANAVGINEPTRALLRYLWVI